MNINGQRVVWATVIVGTLVALAAFSALLPDDTMSDHDRCMKAMNTNGLAVELCEPLLTAPDQPVDYGTAPEWTGYPVVTEFPAEDGYLKVSLQDGTEFTVDTATGHVTVSTPDPDDCDWIWYHALKVAK